MASHNSEVTSSIPYGVGQGPSHSYIYLVAEQELDHPRKPHSYSQELVLTVSWTTQFFFMWYLSPYGDSSSRASPPWFFSVAGWPGFPYIVAAGIQKSKSKTATPSKLGPELAQHHFLSSVFYWLEQVTRPAQLKMGGVFGRQAATLVGVECIHRKRRNCCAAILGDYLPHLKHNLHENTSKEEEKGSLNNRATYAHLTLCLHRKHIK